MHKKIANSEIKKIVMLFLNRHPTQMWLSKHEIRKVEKVYGRQIDLRREFNRALSGGGESWTCNERMLLPGRCKRRSDEEGYDSKEECEMLCRPHHVVGNACEPSSSPRDLLKSFPSHKSCMGVSATPDRNSRIIEVMSKNAEHAVAEKTDLLERLKNHLSDLAKWKGLRFWVEESTLRRQQSARSFDASPNSYLNYMTGASRSMYEDVVTQSRVPGLPRNHNVNFKRSLSAETTTL